MDSKEIFLICIVVSLGLFLLGFVKDKRTFVLKTFSRGILGVFVISFVNCACRSIEIPLDLGINFYTISTTALLGIPGLTLLYAVLGCKIL